MRTIIHASTLCALLLISSNAFAFDIIDRSGSRLEYSQVTAEDEWIIVMLWSHDCIPCERQKPLLSNFSKENQGKGISVVGLSSDDKEYHGKARGILEKGNTHFANYLYGGNSFSDDFKKLTGRAFIGTPTYIVYDSAGAIDGIHFGTISKSDLYKRFAGIVVEKPADLTPGLFR